jgi:hypothetical protein
VGGRVAAWPELVVTSALGLGRAVPSTLPSPLESVGGSDVSPPDRSI